MDSVILITGKDPSKTVISTTVEQLAVHGFTNIEITAFDAAEVKENEALYLLYLSDTEIKTFMLKHRERYLRLGIIPHEGCSGAIRSYGISGDVVKAVDDALDDSRESVIDMVVCNGVMVFNDVIIGDVQGLNRSYTPEDPWLLRISRAIAAVKVLTFKDYTLKTAKEQVVQTAAAGIMIFAHRVSRLSNRVISLHDGRLNALVLAPLSILSHIYFLILMFVYRHRKMNRLPESVGLIRTSRLQIDSSQPMDYKVDGVGMSAKGIECEIVADVYRVRFGRRAGELTDEEQNGGDEKDTVKVAGLPKGEMREMLITEPLRFFKKASENDFKELFLSLKESAKLSAPFIVLMILSTLLATTGLFQSSSPVVIGAMILAPLMAPIVSLAMGVVRADTGMMKESGKTLFFGIIVALMFSAVFTRFMPLDILTDEMRGRVNPNLLDLLVAIFSGIAGAYATAKSEIAKSLAGVAIAVALVPPLSVTGIGLGWGDWHVIFGSFLLFLTNLVGITLAASLTFTVMGYAPIKRAKKGIVMTLAMLVTVAIPLILSFEILIKQNNIHDQLNARHEHTINGKQLRVNVYKVTYHLKRPEVSAEVISEAVIGSEDVRELKRWMESELKQPIALTVTIKTRFQ